MKHKVTMVTESLTNSPISKMLNNIIFFSFIKYSMLWISLYRMTAHTFQVLEK